MADSNMTDRISIIEREAGDITWPSAVYDHAHPIDKMAEDATAPKVADATQQPVSSEEVSRVPSLESGREMDSQKVASKGEVTTQKTTATTSTQPAVANCTFCRIIAKQLPSKIVYEDSDYVCFIDRSPVSTHHFLIVPRQHIRDARLVVEFGFLGWSI